MILQQGIKYSFFKIVPSFLSVFTLSMYSAFLTPEVYGDYSIVMIASSFISIVFYQWINFSLGRMYQEYTNNGERLKFLNSCINLSVLCFILSIIFMSCINYSFDVVSFVPLSIPVLCLLSFCISWNEFILRICNASVQVNLYGTIALIKSILIPLLSFIVFFHGLNFTYLIVAICLSNFISTLVFKFELSRKESIAIDLSVSKKMISYGLPLSIAAIFTLIIDASSRFFIKSYHGSTQVGLFSVPYDMTQLLIGSLMLIINLTLFPGIVKAYEEKNKDVSFINKKLSNAFSVLIFFLVPVVVGFISISKSFIEVFLGIDYQVSSVEIIPIVCVAIFFSCLKSFYFDYAFLLSKKTKPQLYLSVITALLCVFLCWIIVPRYGVIGAAYSACMSFFSSMILSYIIGRKYYTLPGIEFNFLIKVIFSAVLMSFVIFNTNFDNQHINFTAKLILGAFVYMTTVILLNMSLFKAFLVKN